MEGEGIEEVGVIEVVIEVVGVEVSRSVSRLE